jgi:hypothetical protein
VALRHVAQPPPVAELVGRLTEDLDGAGEHLGQPQHAPNEGALPRTVRPLQRHDLATSDREVDRPDDGPTVIADRHAAQAQDLHGRMRGQGQG